jgi:hypothetical protein
MIQKIKPLLAKSVTAFIFCLLLSGCVIYPEDEEFEGFPEEIRAAFLSNAVPPFEGPPERVGLNLSPGYSDYTSSDKIFLLSYTGAEQQDFDEYESYLAIKFGNRYPASGNGYISYGWEINSNVSIELGFSNQLMPVPMGNVSFIPQNTLFLFIVIGGLT